MKKSCEQQNIARKFRIFIILFFSVFQSFSSQENITSDSLIIPKTKLDIKNLIIPATLVSAGFVLLYDHKINENIKNSIQKNNAGFKTSVDNYSQFAPAAAVFALNAFGIKGKHNYKDAALIYIGSVGIASAFVLPLKNITKEERPDFTMNNSFPSGHTAFAFASAEFLKQEYKDSPWIGYAGYAVATATGVLRMYNNRHWFGDVLAGAGFGIASTKISYFLYDKFFVKYGWNFALSPVYSDNNIGINYVYNF